MKKIYALGFSMILVAFLIATASASGTIDDWQIGIPHGAVNPMIGSNEFPATGAWTDSFTYNVDAAADPVNSPQIPGYIGQNNVCFYANDGRPCTDTTKNLFIEFNLACDYSTGGLTLYYDRYGSEAEYLYLDEDLIGNPSTSEGGFNQFTYDLIPSAGTHTLKIEYAGGGAGNGHYIDYLKLESTCFQVQIDIKPGSYPSCFNNNGHGVIPVAIFGSDVLDVYEIDPGTITLEGLAIATKGKSDNLQVAYEDFNGDGFTDLVIKIKDVEGTFSQGNGTATLTGKLLDGTPFIGYGDICITQWNIFQTYTR